MEQITPFERFLENPVFITGYPKSGTTLLLALLDYHPELLVFPEETKFFSRVFRQKDKLAAILCKSGAKVFQYQCVDYPSGHRDYSDIDYQKFTIVLKQGLNQAKNNKEAMLALINAWYQVEHSSKNNKKAWLEKTPFKELFFPLLQRWFNNHLIFLHIIRNPFDTFASYRKKQPQLTIKHFALHWTFSKKIAEHFAKKNHNFHIIEYEALTQEPEKIMKSIAQKLKISYLPCLLKPTRNGHPWEGNSMHGLKFENISKESNNRYKKILTNQEIKKLKQLIYGFDPLFQIKLRCKLARFYFKWRIVNFLKLYA